MLRMDRALRIAKNGSGSRSRATDDPRFHVGWRHLDAVREALKGEVPRLAEPSRALVENHLTAMRRLRGRVGIHSKMQAVGAVVKETVEQGEKVILFCHHHATAQELTVHLASVLPRQVPPRSPARSIWKDAWEAILPTAWQRVSARGPAQSHFHRLVVFGPDPDPDRFSGCLQRPKSAGHLSHTPLHEHAATGLGRGNDS
jgi:hypothetical protein